MIKEVFAEPPVVSRHPKEMSLLSPGGQYRKCSNGLDLCICRTHLPSTNLQAKVEDCTFSKLTFGKIEC